MVRIRLAAASGLVGLVLASACSGGGCSGCGSEPLAEGYPVDETVANAASVRVTRSGLDFIADNATSVADTVLKLNGGPLTFTVPTSTLNGPVGVTLNICPQGPTPGLTPPDCLAEFDVKKAVLNVDAVRPDQVVVKGTLPVRVLDLPVHIANPGPDVGNKRVGLGTNPSCNGTTPVVDWKDFPLTLTIPIIEETAAPRTGYTRLDIDATVIELGLDNNDAILCNDGGISGTIANAAKDLFFGSITGGLQNMVRGLLKDAMCTKPNFDVQPECPNHSSIDKERKYCVLNSDPPRCMPTLLGSEGHVKIGALLSSLSPGTKGAFDYVFAAGGAMNPAPGQPADDTPYVGHTPNGISLGILGGTAPRPLTDCVPIAENIPPTAIPVPDEMLANAITPWSGATPPHLGIALSRRYLNYALVGAYNSGVLCLGVTTEQTQQLHTGLLSLLIKSIPQLAMEQKPAAVGITTRPGAPPKLTLGGGTDLTNDPLIWIQLDRFAVDFYVFSLDRYVRAFTFTADVKVPVMLSTAVDPQRNPNGGLLPAIGDLQLTDPEVTNADLLTDDPTQVAGALQSILGGLTSQISGGLGPIDLSSATQSLGLSLQIPDGGIRRLQKGADDFVGIFANFGVGGAPLVRPAPPSASIDEKHVDPAAMTLSTLTREGLPSLDVTLGRTSPGLEFGWAIDDAAPAHFSPEPHAHIQTHDLAFEGKHTLAVYTRQHDAPWLVSEATRLPFVIDTLAPHVEIAVDDSGAHVKAWDIVSDESKLEGRYRLTSDPSRSSFGPWQPVSALRNLQAPLGSQIELQVRDEEGNVQTIEQALIRGRRDDTLDPGGCSCTLVGHRDAGGSSSLPALGAGALALLFALRRRRSQGRTGPRVQLSPAWRRPLGLAALGSGFAILAGALPGCGCGSESGTGCGADCNQACEPALEPGMVGAYTSFARAPDGTIWAAGYADAAVRDGESVLYGDLVVGKVDYGDVARVDWQIIDGVPTRDDGSCPGADPTGWRAGESEPGDNVGLWTSIAVGDDGQPMLAYYDATNKALKFATFDGRAWNKYTLAGGERADLGRYAKLRFVQGVPVVAFLALDRADTGKMRSRIVLAKGSSARPNSKDDWSFEDVMTDEAPCRAWVCLFGESCSKDTGVCAKPETGCSPDPCGDGKVCGLTPDGPACQDTYGQTFLEPYPRAQGLYIAMDEGPKGLGIAYYDRVHGNVVVAQNTGGYWATRIVDGEVGDRTAGDAKDTGDVGLGLSLSIDAHGDWHISYVDGLDEALRYVLMVDGAAPFAPEIVDDGTTTETGGGRFPDGRHVVGDDSFIETDDAGTVTIYYQDATSGVLRIATGAPTGGPSHIWTTRGIAQPGRFAGYFPKRVPGTPFIANYFRKSERDTKSMFGDVAFVTP